MQDTAIAQEVVEEVISNQTPRIPEMDEIIAQMGNVPLLPKPYISMSTTPNRRARRKAKQFAVRRMHRFETWKQTLLANFINPEDVLLERRQRAKIKRLPRVRTRTTTHNQRRRAAQRRKHGS